MTEIPAPAETRLDFDAHRPLPERFETLATAFADAVAGTGQLAVAFSGGVDSSLVLALGVRARGVDEVFAVLGVSPSLAERERVDAHRVADIVGVRVVEVSTREAQDPRYVANDADRCYFCKHELYSRSMLDVVAAAGASSFVNGDTADDVDDPDRAGRRAATELGIGSPLATAGIGKADVREMGRLLGLPVWDKPSAPCLASRIPRATPVTVDRLREVERAEAGLRDLGIRELRVRHHGHSARVQLGERDHESLGDDGAAQVEEIVRAAGFREVHLDLVPLRRA